MNYYLRKYPGAPIEGPHPVATLRAFVEGDPSRQNWQITGDIGEPRERVEQSPDRDWFPVSQLTPGLSNPSPLPRTSGRPAVEPAPSPRSPRSYSPDDTRRLQELCRQRRASADRWQRWMRPVVTGAMLLFFGSDLVARFTQAFHWDVTTAQVKAWSLVFLAVVVFTLSVGSLKTRSRCPGCGASLPSIRPRDPRNDVCGECGLQLSPIVEAAVPAPRVCPDEEARRLQSRFAKERRQAQFVEWAGLILVLVGAVLLVILFSRTAPLGAVDATLILAAMIGGGVGLRLLNAPWRVCCGGCGQQLIGGDPAKARHFCHFCAQPIRELAKRGSFGLAFRYECACQPGVPQGSGRDRLSKLSHCPHCGVKLTSTHDRS
jgi:predicted anti-sigma-YlaC factor YlaD